MYHLFHEAGLATADICRKYGLSPATFYKLKAKFGGLEVPDVRRLRQRKDEKLKLRPLHAEAMLDKTVLKDLLVKP
ncbi:MAG: transposase [Roseomonas sp.]|nr:transposase [Roseomonas sp.]